jgi:hypothetical protein
MANVRSAGYSFTNGAAGGESSSDKSIVRADGGFGGGGASSYEGGGGGGYAGGRVVFTNNYDRYYSNFGATSFSAGSNLVGETGVGYDHGYVKIRLVR